MMKWKTFVVGYALALALLLFAQHRPQQPTAATFTQIIDLTHGIGSAPAAAVSSRALLPRPVSAAESYPQRQTTSIPFPTRLQAPAHYAPGLWTVAQIPPERLFAPLAVIDIHSQARNNADYQLTVADIANWERVHGQIPLGAVVAVRTGWAARWSSPRAYRNRDERGIPHFPGFSAQAVQFLVQGRKIVGLGIDTPGIDPGNVSNSPAADYALSHSVYQIDNLANLAKAPEVGGLALVAPAKLQDRSQAPTRVLALAK